MTKINVCLTKLDHQFNHQAYDVFLGDWAVQNQADFGKTLPNPLNSQEKLERASDEIDDMLSRMLEALANYMNSCFKVDFSVRFWKIYITPFLLHWISSNYFRYLALDQLRSKNSSDDKFDFNFIKNENDFTIKTNEDYIVQIIYLESFSHLYFQKMIRYMFAGRYEIKNEMHASTEVIPQKELKKTLRDFSRELMSFGGNYYLGGVKGLSVLDKSLIALLNVKKIVKSFFVNSSKTKNWEKINAANPEGKSKNLKDWGFIPKNEFETIMSELVIDVLPENFYHAIPAQPLIRRVSYWVGNAPNIYQDIWSSIGRIIENGGKWISVQHGGVYGHVYKNGYANIEYVLTDNFVTWGWTQSPPYNVNPIVLPSPVLSKFKKAKLSPTQKILYVGTVGVYIPFRITSVMQTITFSEYKNLQLQFVKQLSNDAKKSLWFRDHAIALAPNHEFYQYLNQYKIPFCGKYAYLAAKESRLVVIDHCSTAFLETMVMNVPTIIFWNEDVAKLNSVAFQEFLKLKKVGIWHESGVDAANFINSNIADIEGWWNSAEVQNAKNAFLELYGKTSDHYLTEWAGFLKTLK